LLVAGKKKERAYPLSGRGGGVWHGREEKEEKGLPLTAWRGGRKGNGCLIFRRKKGNSWMKKKREEEGRGAPFFKKERERKRVTTFPFTISWGKKERSVKRSVRRRKNGRRDISPFTINSEWKGK